MRLLTPRLLLRPVRAADAPLVHDMATRPGFARLAGYPKPKSLRETAVRLGRSIAAWRKPGAKTEKKLTFSILRRKDGAWLGLVDLRWPHKGVGELGYSVHPDHWRQGYGTEAVRKLVSLGFELGAHRVQATCWVKNAGSAGVLRNAGLRKEGVLRGYLRRGREVQDVFMFGVSRKDFFTGEKPV